MARIAFGPVFVARSAKICFLISSFSDAASITICTSRISTGAVEATMRARPCFRFFFAHQSALHGVGVGFFDIGKAAIDQLRNLHRAK